MRNRQGLLRFVLSSVSLPFLISILFPAHWRKIAQYSFTKGTAEISIYWWLQTNHIVECWPQCTCTYFLKSVLISLLSSTRQMRALRGRSIRMNLLTSLRNRQFYSFLTGSLGTEHRLFRWVLRRFPRIFVLGCSALTPDQSLPRKYVSATLFYPEKLLLVTFRSLCIYFRL